MGEATAKQFLLLGGRPLWLWSAVIAQRLFAAGAIHEGVFVVPAGCEAEAEAALRPFSFPWTVTAGGAERSRSVLQGLRAATGDFVLVHDGARPFLTEALCRRVVAAASEERGVVPLLPLSDALKRIDEAGEPTPCPREGVGLTQTPQCFHRLELEKALSTFGAGVKDEAEAWHAAGGKLTAVEGDRCNMKITWPEDLTFARSLAQKSFRTGMGYDVHPLVPGRKLLLGGVLIPGFPLGVLGHSDGDAMVHALCDALLGASGLGDIGTLYPASCPGHKDRDSLFFLEDTARSVQALGWTMEWADGVLIAQEPRLAPYVSVMLSAMDGALPPSWRGKMNLKVKSGEGEGNVGQCCSVVSHMVVTLSAPAWLSGEDF